MALQPSSRLGQYEIVSALGAGGMGEVYRARDTKLGREVAIKLILETVSAHPERRARFEREARVLASLSHANIATLFGFETVDGTSFLTMELVEGEDLADRIARGPIPFDEAAALFLQIADGLEAAHAKGVIHRDLKPANLKIGPDGTVKILDFGLAKAVAQEGRELPEAGLSNSPTLTVAATQRGEILGTAAYMSPEQVRGLDTDKRCDVWAFGVCLMEALTGRRVFAGQDASFVLASVLKDEPDMSALPADVPRAIHRLLRRCLTKDPQLRLRDIGDARLELRDALDPDRVEPESPRLASRRPLFALAASCVVLAGLAVWGWLSRSGPEPGSRPVRRFEIDLGTARTLTDWSTYANVALSPDGTLLAYAASGEEDVPFGSRLYLRRLGELESKAIPGTEHALMPFFSPDGEWIGYYTADYRGSVDEQGRPLLTGLTAITKVSIHGGAPVKVADAWPPTGATWLDDGSIVFVATRPHRAYWDEERKEETGLFRVDQNGGAAVRLRSVDPDADEQGLAHPRALPDQRHILFTIFYVPGQKPPATAVIDSRSGESSIILPNAAAATYAAPGHLLFMRDGTLWTVPFDLRALRPSGQERPLLPGLQWQVEPMPNAPFSLSAEGSLVAVPERARAVAERRLVWVDPATGTREPLPLPPIAGLVVPRVSPDGRFVSFLVQQEGERRLWLHERARDESRILLSRGDWIDTTTWDPSSRSLVYSISRQDPTIPMRSFSQIRRVRSDGSGQVDLEMRERDRYAQRFPEDVSPGGEIMLDERGETGWDLSVAKGEEVEGLLETSYNEIGGIWSPDGRWLAYYSDESGVRQVYVRPYPNVDAGRWQVSLDGGWEPVWAPDGSRIYYRKGGEIWASPVSTSHGFSSGTPVRVFEGFAIPESGRHWDLEFPKGERFVVIEENAQPPQTGKLLFIENFLELVKREGRP